MLARTLLVVGLGVTAVVSVVATTAPQNKPATQCTLTGKGTFDIGWVEQQKDQRFRCVPTFAPSLERSGVAWVRVDADGKTQVP